MTVHINGNKGKDLYYGGTKIKEAYYNGNKVYSSGPLYYCYTYPAGDGPGYVFLNSYPEVNAVMDVYCNNGSTLIKPTSSNELIVLYSNCTVISVTNASVRLRINMPPYGTFDQDFTRDASSDLYT